MKKTVEAQETWSQSIIHIEIQTNQVKSTLDELIKASYHITDQKKDESFMKSFTSEDHSLSENHSLSEKYVHNNNIKSAKLHWKDNSKSSKRHQKDKKLSQHHQESCSNTNLIENINLC